jgi:hypothetical protein
MVLFEKSMGKSTGSQENLYFYFMKKKNIPLETGDYYLSSEGYKVFTAQYHLKRGYCCKSNCRHCPYGYDPKTA